MSGVFGLVAEAAAREVERLGMVEKDRPEMSQEHHDRMEHRNRWVAVVTVLVVLGLFGAGVVAVLLVT